MDIIRDSKISDIFHDEGINVKEICSLIRGDHKYGSLISGEIDGDRLDYLMRDSHYTGVKTGVDTGLSVINPINNKAIPLWIADYVLIKRANKK